MKNRYKQPEIDIDISLKTTNIQVKEPIIPGCPGETIVNKMLLVTQICERELDVFLRMLGDAQILSDDYSPWCTKYIQYIQEQGEELKSLLCLLINEDALERLYIINGLIPEKIRIEKDKMPACYKDFFD